MDESTSLPAPRVLRIRPGRPLPTLSEDVRATLLRRPRSLAPKYFYDARGAQLFDRICDTREYYPTRTEQALLEASAGEIVRGARPDHLFELGSGNSRKTRELLDACAAAGLRPEYWPLDVSAEMLVESATLLARQYPWIRIHCLVGDYGGGLGGLPPLRGRELALFLGGTIGNFTPAQAGAFLRELARHLDRDDQLLIGLDRVKDRAVLEAAYNDSEGLTARFNRNILRVLNRGLNADFKPDAFEHRAIYNADESQIEMYLVSARAQRVTLGDLDAKIELEAGEPILTEISRKFSAAAIGELLASGGFRETRRFDAPDEWYSLVLAEKD